MWFSKRKKIQKPHPLDVLADIRRELHEFFPQRRAIACYRARALRVAAQPLLPDLIRRAVDLDPVVREAATEALVAMSPASIHRLCEELVEDERHRHMAVDALRRIGAPAVKELRDLLLYRIPEYAHHARIAALELLRAQGTKSAEECAQLLRSDFSDVQRECASHLVSLGERAISSLEFVLAHGAVSEEHSKRIALVLSTIGDAGLPTLIKMLGSKNNHALRFGAVAGTLDYLNAPEAEMPKHLIPRLQRCMPRLLWNLDCQQVELRCTTLRLIARLARYATPEFRTLAVSAVVFIAMNEQDATLRRALDIAASALDVAA